MKAAKTIMMSIALGSMVFTSCSDEAGSPLNDGQIISSGRGKPTAVVLNYASSGSGIDTAAKYAGQSVLEYFAITGQASSVFAYTYGLEGETTLCAKFDDFATAELAKSQLARIVWISRTQNLGQTGAMTSLDSAFSCDPQPLVTSKSELGDLSTLPDTDTLICKSYDQQTELQRTLVFQEQIKKGRVLWTEVNLLQVQPNSKFKPVGDRIEAYQNNASGSVQYSSPKFDLTVYQLDGGIKVDGEVEGVDLGTLDCVRQNQ